MDKPAIEFPAVILSWTRDGETSVTVSLGGFPGAPPTIDVSLGRLFGDRPNVPRPVAGLSIDLRHLPQLVEAFTKAEQVARESGLLVIGRQLESDAELVERIALLGAEPFNGRAI